MYRLATAGLVSFIVLCTPALALPVGPLATPGSGVVKVACNPGTPNCTPTDIERQKVEKNAQGVMQDPAHNEGQCQGNGLCGNDSGGRPSPIPTVKQQSGGQTTSQSSGSSQQKESGGNGGGSSHH
jgi:hypothetical protein